MSIHKTINVENLKRFRPDEKAEAPPTPLSNEKGEPLYIVDKIVGERTKRGKTLFKIRWKGYGPQHDSWEPAKEFEDAAGKDLIEKFRDTLVQGRRPKKTRKGK